MSVSENNSHKLVLLGAGGHCKSVIDVVRSAGFDIKGILDVPGISGRVVSGIPVIGTDNDIPKFVREDCMFLITLGDIGLPGKRKQLYDRLHSAGAKLATVAAKTAYVSAEAEIGEGTVILHGAFVNAGSVIGKNAVVNTRALIEHDCHLADHVQVAPGAILNGGIRLGEGVYIGSGSIIRERIEIAEGVVVGMGSIVTADLTEPGLYYGTPARLQKRHSP